MKTDKLAMIEIIKEEIEKGINELFDFKNVPDYDYNYHAIDDSLFTNSKSLIGNFTLDDGAKVNVYIENIDRRLIYLPPVFDLNHGVVNFVFSIEGTTKQYKKTTLKELLRIVKTVSQIVQKFVISHNENILYTLYAEPKLGNDMLSDPQKSEMYQMVIGKYLPSGFRVGKGTYGGLKLPIIAFQKNKIKIR